MRILRAAFVACCFFCLTASAVAQSASQAAADNGGPFATLTFSNAKSLRTQSREGRFGLIGIAASQSVTIDLQFPAAFANVPVVVQPLDGGAITFAKQSSFADGNAALSITFTAGASPGRYRILLNAAGVTTIVQFWVASPVAGINPPVLQPN